MNGQIIGVCGGLYADGHRLLARLPARQHGAELGQTGQLRFDPRAAVLPRDDDNAVDAVAGLELIRAAAQHRPPADVEQQLIPVLHPGGAAGRDEDGDGFQR